MNQNKNEKTKKLQNIIELKREPYPHFFAKKHSLHTILKEQETYIATQQLLVTAGRFVSSRRMGKVVFGELVEQHQKLQIYLAQKNLPEDYELVSQLDIGDILGVEGTLFRTKLGETTLSVTKLVLLSKALLPWPIPKEKKVDDERVVFDQFKDKQIRYRQRPLDLTLNKESYDVFYKRTKIVENIRHYLNNNGYLEVETPILQPIYGGANARPFVTHHNTLDMKLYLRIANELYLKRCIIGGMERVYEFSKDFRNEGIDRTHNPEFTQIEFYQAYADYHIMMEHFENIYNSACQSVNGSSIFYYQGQKIDLTPPWRRLSMKDALKQYAEIDIDILQDNEIQNILSKYKLQLPQYNRGLATEKIFAELCEHKLIEPVFIMDHPKETTPLCKAHREHKDLIERFEPYINGWEIGNGYTELNDPILQRTLLLEQKAREEAGEQETHPMDENFLQALEYGMPPTGGIGMGIDRMVMLLTNQKNIRDVILFPLLKAHE